MRLLALFILWVISTTTHAQFTISVNGGLNTTTAHIAKTNYSYGDYVDRLGWQAGLGAEYGFKHSPWLLCSGLGVANKNVYNQINRYDDLGVTYKPVFVTLPLGAGYNYHVSKKINLRLYAGMYGLLGVAGKYHEEGMSSNSLQCMTSVCPETYPIYPITNGDIHFGNHSTGNFPDELTRFNWGTQFGLGLKTWQRFELVCMYNWGLSNILPGDGQEGNIQLRSVAIDLKVDIITYKPSKK